MPSQNKGRVGPDGKTRYYNPSKHAWETRHEIEQEQKAQNAVNIMLIIAMIIIGGGGFLWMLVETFSR